MDLFKKSIRLYKNITNDIRYGEFLGGVKKTKFALNGAYDTANSDYEALDLIFSRLYSENSNQLDVLVDIGCGKGRVINYWLNRFPSSKIYGIELDPDVAKNTASRLRSYGQVKILCGDARELIPMDASLFYLFNPFNEIVVAAFLQQFRNNISNKTLKPATIIYYNPMHINVFARDSLCTIEEMCLPHRFHKAFIIRVAPDLDMNV